MARMNLSPRQLGIAKMHVIFSACFGALSSGLIGDSPIIMIMAEKMHAGPALSLVTTALIPLSYAVMLLPMGFLAAKLGYRKTILTFTLLGFCAMLLVTFSSWGGISGPTIMLTGIFLYGVFLSAYNAAWFPFLDNILPKEQRHSFFGYMRFSWQGSNVLFIFICGLLIGKTPSMFALQTVTLIATLGLLGRILHVWQIPQPSEKSEPVRFLVGVGDAIRNKALSGYSVYLCFLYLFSFSTQPLAFIYVKNGLNIPANLVVIVSALALAGAILGFLTSGMIINRLKLRPVMVACHLTFIVINLSMFLISGNSVYHIALITLLLFINAFMLSLVSITTTSEMLGLSTPWNRAMSMAYCGSFYSLGSGGARLLSSLILGSGMLAPTWTLGSQVFSNYQTLFLFNGCSLIFACLLLVLVPAVFPKGKYRYTI